MSAPIRTTSAPDELESLAIGLACAECALDVLRLAIIAALLALMGDAISNASQPTPTK
jgi:hypothetical protein